MTVDLSVDRLGADAEESRYLEDRHSFIEEVADLLGCVGVASVRLT